ncbi:MAG: Gfo/Idh/MocA family oxidoreductase [Opitutaceae bacterium]|jgi:predicted dehydrogenase|nr:Gfo/Idh/MocA family oxidoreductase [Opitutaceae bacterium]MBP9913977.1 Gfo/Idh/MocA family oxidoreductase [Opitutaceae bacterium]
MVSSTELGFGIIGTGMIADYHARAITEATGARLVGICGRTEAKVRPLAEKHHAPFWTTDVAALVARPDIHIVCITTPSGAHLEPALAAIRAGKHVVVEKPLEITPARVDALLAAAAAAGVIVAPIFQSRFGAGAQRVKAAVAAGRLGRLVLASVYIKWHRQASYYQGWKGTRALDGGGAVMNQGIHGIDLLQWFAGLPAEIFAWKTRRVHTGIESEDTACAALRFANGALGTIEASTALYPGWARRIELCGENGSITLEDDRITQWNFREPQPGDETATAAADNALGSGASAPNAISHQGHLRQIQNLVDHLRSGAPLLIDGPEARKAVALICALYASAESGVPVKI